MDNLNRFHNLGGNRFRSCITDTQRNCETVGLYLQIVLDHMFFFMIRLCTLINIRRTSR